MSLYVYTCAICLQIIYNTIVTPVSAEKEKTAYAQYAIHRSKKKEKDPGQDLFLLQKVRWELYCPGRSRSLAC